MPGEDRVADLAIEMATCRTDKELRVASLENWKIVQNNDLRRIRQKTSGILIAIILLLIGVVTNLVIDRSQPDVRAVVEQVLESIERP